MGKYVYLLGINTISALLVVVLFSGTGLNLANFSERIAGVGTNRAQELVDFALNQSGHVDFEVYCDELGNYAVAHEVSSLAKIPSQLQSKFKLINGRGYYLNLNYTEARLVWANYFSLHPKSTPTNKTDVYCNLN